MIISYQLLLLSVSIMFFIYHITIIITLDIMNNDTDEKTQIIDCYLLHGKWSKVSTVLDIPLRTLYRKRVKYSIDEEVRITDDDLHALVSKVIEEQPLAGNKIVKGAVKSEGKVVTNSKLRSFLKPPLRLV